MADVGWDLSDFVNKYTTKSNQIQSSPLRIGDDSMLNASNGSDAPSPSKIEKLEDDEDLFCTLDNLQDRLNFLNQELSMHGFPSLYNKKSRSNRHPSSIEDFDVTKLVNCTYELLRRQHHHVKVKDDLEERHLRSENDNEYLLQNQVRLKQDLENLKRESALLLCREKEQIEKCRVLTQDVKAEREEKRKLKSDIEHLKKQFYHESKRTEKEISRLKEKVHQLLNDKSTERKFGIDVLNSLQRGDGKRSTWKTAGKKQEEEMYKMIISTYEDKEKNLLTENIALRETIGEVQNLLYCFDTSVTSEIVEEESRQLQMPYSMVKLEVEQKFHNVIKNLKDRLENGPIKEPSPLKEPDHDTSINSKQISLDDLHNRLEQCKAVISGQEAIIQGLKEGYTKEAFERALLTFGISEENYEESERRLNKLREEERKFNEERKNFTDYVIKISKEREEFEKERVEFYMHCISTPVTSRDKKLHPKGSTKHTLRMATPSFSPAPSMSRKKENMTSKSPPSTAELYRYMSLNYDGPSSRTLERNLNGSFVQSPDGSPSPKKLHEHAENVRRAVEQRHNKSMEEDERKQFPGNMPLYVME